MTYAEWYAIGEAHAAKAIEIAKRLWPLDKNYTVDTESEESGICVIYENHRYDDRDYHRVPGWVLDGDESDTLKFIADTIAERENQKRLADEKQEQEKAEYERQRLANERTTYERLKAKFEQGGKS